MPSTPLHRSRFLARAALALALICASAGVFVSAQRPAAPEAERVALFVELDDEPITPGTVTYLVRAIETAEERGAECLVLRLDTPGGLVDSTRTLVKRMLAAEVPVVVHVAPDGARAASAGVFITLAAHVAAMSESATIGAASPVLLGGLPTGPAGEGEDQAQPSVMERKIVEDTASWARALAARHGRAGEWAERAVRESVSATGAEAFREGIVDLLAEDTASLLEAIDGWEVTVAEERRVLRTSGLDLEPLERSWIELFLGFVSQPNLAFLLLMIGFYALVFEFSSPGIGAGAVVGVVALVLAMFGLAVLPVSGLGLFLVLLALGLFVAEAFVPSFGLLTVGGVVALILGGSMLIDSPAGFLRVSLSLVVPFALASAVVSLTLLGGAVRALRRPPSMGDALLIGASTRACADFTREGERWTGQVHVHGERWQAEASEALSAHERCRVAARDGLSLWVERAPDSS